MELLGLDDQLHVFAGDQLLATQDVVPLLLHARQFLAQLFVVDLQLGDRGGQLILFRFQVVDLTNGLVGQPFTGLAEGFVATQLLDLRPQSLDFALQSLFFLDPGRLFIVEPLCFFEKLIVGLEHGLVVFGQSPLLPESFFQVAGNPFVEGEKFFVFVFQGVSLLGQALDLGGGLLERGIVIINDSSNFFGGSFLHSGTSFATDVAVGVGQGTVGTAVIVWVVHFWLLKHLLAANEFFLLLDIFKESFVHQLLMRPTMLGLN